MNRTATTCGPSARQRYRFADVFRGRLLSWAVPGTTVGCDMAVSPGRRLVLMTWTLHGSGFASRSDDAGTVEAAIARAREIAPTADPLAGDLSMFDGPRILMFRRFDEPWDVWAATAVANEVGSAILMAGDDVRRAPEEDR